MLFGNHALHHLLSFFDFLKGKHWKAKIPMLMTDIVREAANFVDKAFVTEEKWLVSMDEKGEVQETLSTYRRSKVNGKKYSTYLPLDNRKVPWANEREVWLDVVKNHGFELTAASTEWLMTVGIDFDDVDDNGATSVEAEESQTHTDVLWDYVVAHEDIEWYCRL